MGRGAWVLLGVLAACGKHPEPPGAGSGSAAFVGRLFTDAELAASSHALDARLVASARSGCARPVIGGAATAGASTDAIASLVEPGGALATCLDRMSAMLNHGDLNELIVRRDPELLEVDRACGDLVTSAILDAGAHAEGCSPYQVGARVPKGLLPAVSAARLLSVHARLLAASGDPGSALLLIVRAFGMFQDLGRGHVSLLVAMVANGAKTVLLEHAWAITRGALPVATLDRAARALDIALATEPPFRDMLEGERDTLQLAARAHPTKRYTRDVRDDEALTFAFTTSATASYLAACPAAGGLAACHRALATLAEANAERASDLTEDPIDLVDQLAQLLPKADDAAAREALRIKTRTAMVQTLSIAESYNPQASVAPRGATMSRLASLRVHIEVLRFIAKEGRCPTVIELDAPPFQALVAPAVLGDQLSVERRGTTLRVTPPAWVGSTYPPWEISCPR